MASLSWPSRTSLTPLMRRLERRHARPRDSFSRVLLDHLLRGVRLGSRPGSSPPPARGGPCRRPRSPWPASTIFSTSSFARPDEWVMVTFCSLPVALSLALTLRMPLASMSNVTSICGTPRGAGGMPVRWKRPEAAVVAGHLALTLQHVDLHLRLAVRRRGERLRLAGGDGGVALDELGHHAAQRLHAERQRGDVQQEDVLHLAGEHAGLHRRAHRHHLVRVHRAVRLLAEQLLHRLLHLRDARGAADEHDLVEVLRGPRPSPSGTCGTAPASARRGRRSSPRTWRA